MEGMLGRRRRPKMTRGGTELSSQRSAAQKIETRGSPDLGPLLKIVALYLLYGKEIHWALEAHQ